MIAYNSETTIERTLQGRSRRRAITYFRDNILYRPQIALGKGLHDDTSRGRLCALDNVGEGVERLRIGFDSTVYPDPDPRRT